MPRKAQSTLASPADRLALAPRGKPYIGEHVAPGVRLYYRRSAKGAGAWIIETALGDGRDRQERLGGKTGNVVADDIDAADGVYVLSYRQAIERARIESRGGVDTTKVATFASALAAYREHLTHNDRSPTNATQVMHHLAGLPLFDKPLTALTAQDLQQWRDGLIKSGVKAQTVVRTMKSARAALNLAAFDPRVAANREAWKVGLSGLVDQYEPVKRTRTDAEVFALIAAAYDRDPAFGVFVDVLARTGARTSQVAGLTVGDLQADRLMMPSSRKGKGRKVSHYPVPIDRALAAQLHKLAAGRPDDAPLLADQRVFFAPRDGWFAKIARALGIDDTAYCLRHSSISRALLAGTPIALVAKNHDTSVAIIERVYGRFINQTDEAEKLTRAGQLGAAPLRLVA